MSPNLVYLDIETSGLDPFKDKISLIQLLEDGKDIIRLIKNLTPQKIFEIKDLLQNSLVVGHNLKFDLKFLKHHYGIEPSNLFDTWIAEILISGGQKARQKNTTTLEIVAKHYTGVELDKSDELRHSFKGGKLTDEQKKYAALDVAVLPDTYEQQKQKLKELGLEGIFAIEMGCIPATVWLELSGICLDPEALKRLESETVQKLEDAGLKVLGILKESGYRNLDLCGLPALNLDSPKQLLEALQAIGLKVDSTGDETLVELKHPIGKALGEYREHQKLLTTFIRKLPEHIHEATGRIHSDFNQCGTIAGRFSCSKPNLQQLPRGAGVQFRPSKGYKMVAGDYNQIELRILAEVSEEPRFVEIFNNGGDLHKLTASLVFNKPISQVTEEERYMAKSINFGLNYGMGPLGLQADLRKKGVEISKEQAKKYIDTFFKNYPKIKKYLDNISGFAVRHGYVRTKAGRLIRYPFAQDEREKATIARNAKNNPIQGLGADILKIAMGRLYHKLKPYNAKLINAIHDELVFEVPEEYVEEASKVIKNEMEVAGREFLKSVPCVVEVKIVEAWEK